MGDFDFFEEENEYIDDVIEHCPEDNECSSDHLQYADWLELKQYEMHNECNFWQVAD